MLEWTTVDRARQPDGVEFSLARHGDEWVVRVDGRTLMSSRMHDSEEALADEALSRVDAPSAVLVGGLGLGFTLRAALDRVEPACRVTVAELVPAIVQWNRDHVGALADHPLRDPRCDVVIGDVRRVLAQRRGAFDAILLDVDNGPVALSSPSNQALYSERGVRACRDALRPGGVLVVWSSGPSPRFERRLASAGLDTEVVRSPARAGSRARHVLFVGAHRPALSEVGLRERRRREAWGRAPRRLRLR